MARAGGDARFDSIEIESQSCFGIDVAIGVRNATVEFDLRLVNWVAGVGVEYSLTFLHHRGNVLANCWLTAWLD